MDNTTVAQATPVPEGPKSLTGIGALLKKSWSVYKDKIWLAIGILAAPVILMALSALVGRSFLAMILSLASTLVMFGAQGALILLCLKRESNLNIKAAYQSAWPKYWSLVWVALLTAFVTIGGFWLLIVPGIIFTIWFMFSMVVLMAEDERGMKALIKSREYVRGYFWPVLWRYLIIIVLVIITYMVAGAIILVAVGNNVGSAVLMNLIMLLVVPAAVIYQVMLYEDLKTVKGPVEVKEQAKTTYLLVGAAGWMFVVIVVLVATSLVMSILGFILGGGLNNIEGLPEGFETPEIQLNIPAELQDQLEQLETEQAL